MPVRFSTLFVRGAPLLLTASALGVTALHAIGWGFAAVIALPRATMYLLQPSSVAVVVLGGISMWAAQSLSRATASVWY